LAKRLAKSWQGGSGRGSGGRGRGGEGGGGAGTAVIKSNNPHLAGGEKQEPFTINFGWFQIVKNRAFEYV
jgi:hypothetical protein